jgi:hypothetical protein
MPRRDEWLPPDRRDEAEREQMEVRDLIGLENVKAAGKQTQGADREYESMNN